MEKKKILDEISQLIQDIDKCTDRYINMKKNPNTDISEFWSTIEQMSRLMVEAHQELSFLYDHIKALYEMKEAGFEWNVEKKELKKIEQNLAEQNVDNRKLCDIVIEELGKYSGNEVYKAPWALDSTGVQYPLYFAELGAKWQKENKPAENKGINLVEEAWSEEDERLFDSVVWNLRYSVNTRDVEHSAGQLEDWLQSLKGRYTWKPSEKQMEAIRIAAEVGTANDSWAMNILKSMYQDLQKLRKE